VERVIEYEIKRQTELWESGKPPSVLTTRGWNDKKQKTELQRTKEEEADYRYSPEPDMPPMDLSEMEDEIAKSMPELPRAKRNRLMEEYGFKLDTAKQLIEDPKLVDFTEQAMSELGAWLNAHPDIGPEDVEERRRKLSKLFSSWLLNKLMGLLSERKIDIRTMKVNPENFAEFIILLANGKLTGPSGLKVLAEMLDSGADPSHAMADLGAERIDDADALGQIVDTIIEENPAEAERYRNGEKKLTQFFVGQAMKASKGSADPQTVARLLSERLGE
jgi:aspartyl-tRNA(Asn)/glutamyl-tRNA(Gln) amidotransferase subunit B